MVVFPGVFDGVAVVGGLLGQHAGADGGAGLQGEAQIASVTKVGDDVVAVDVALYLFMLVHE